MARTRILFVTHTLDLAAGGAEQVLYDLLAELDRSRFEPIVSAPAPTPAQRRRLQELRVELFELPPFEVYRGKRWTQALGATRSLAYLCIGTMRAIRRTRPHVAHVNSVVALHFSVLAFILMRVPFVYHEHGFVSQRVNSPWHPLFRRLLRRTDQIVANADATRGELVAAGVPSEKITVAHNGLCIDSRRPSRETQLADHRTVGFSLLQIANLHRWKGHATVIRALARLRSEIPEASLVIFGSGAEPGYLDELQRLIIDLGLSANVKFVGYVEKACDKIAEFDCLVVASDGEPFGLVILEAMWAGVPVVASNAGGVPEIITDGHDGLLFAPGDDVALGDRLREIGSDMELRRRLVKAGRATVSERFSTATQARIVEEVLTGIVGTEH